MDTLVLPKPAYNILRRLTGETRPDVALSIALKDLVRLRLEAVQAVIAGYEEKYGMSFSEFQQAWQAVSPRRILTQSRGITGPGRPRSAISRHFKSWPKRWHDIR